MKKSHWRIIGWCDFLNNIQTGLNTRFLLLRKVGIPLRLPFLPGGRKNDDQVTMYIVLGFSLALLVFLVYACI